LFKNLKFKINNMSEPTYQNAISKAWQIVWHNKALWIFGLLSVVIGQFGLSDFFGRLIMIYNKHQIIGNWFAPWSGGVSNFISWDWQSIIGIIWLGGLGLFLLVAIIFLAITSQGALIAYSTSAFTTKRFAHAGKAWHKGVKHFWQLLGVNIFYRLLLCVILLISAFFLKFYFFYQNKMVGALIVIMLVIFLFCYLVLSIVFIYSAGYVVADNNTLFRSISRGWKLFRRHVLVSFEVGLLLMFFNLVLLVILVSSAWLAFLPAGAILIIAGMISSGGLAIAAVVVGFFIWLAIIILLAGIFNAFTVSAWMYLFVKMHKEGVASRVAHWIGKIFKR
jgi:hypothetical protein